MLGCLVKVCGADINQETNDGATALHLAAQYGHLDVLKCLVNELGADVNKAAVNGITPLYTAAQNGHLALVVFLVNELGARLDINKESLQLSTPLMAASITQHNEVVRWLLQHGANAQTKSVQCI